MIAVEIHTAEGARPVTQWTYSVRWTDRVTAPHQSIDLVMQGAPTVRPVRIGEHIAVRITQNGPAVAWGIVVAVASSHEVSGARSSIGKWRVSAVGWFDYLSRVDIVPTMTATDQGAGTFFGQAEYAALIGDSMNAFAALPPGQSLAAFIRRLLRIRMPPSLGGDTLGNTVSVAYDAATAASHCGTGRAERERAPARAVEPIPASRTFPVQGLSGSSKAASMISGTWRGDPDLIELFPSLEDPGGYSTLTQAIQELRASEAVQAFDPESPPALTVQAPVNRTGDILQRTPVLLYRVRPWRTDPLSQFIRGTVTYQVDTARSIFHASLRTGRIIPLPIAPDVLSAVATYPTVEMVTWDLSRASVLGLGDTHGLQFATADEDGPNLFSVEAAIGVANSTTWEAWGLPIVDPTSLAARGARMRIADWPFVRGVNASPNQTTDTVKADCLMVAAQLYQFMGAGDRFARGSIRCKGPRPDIRHGEPVIVSQPGGVSSYFAAYVEGTTNEVTIEGTQQIWRTSLDFSRGLFETTPSFEDTAPALTYPQALA